MIVFEVIRSELERVAVSLFIDIPGKTAQEYYEKLKNHQEGEFKKACDFFKTEFQPTAYKKFPTIGEFLAHMAKQRAQSEYVPEQPTKDGADQNCVAAYFAVLGEIKIWHDKKLVKYHQQSCKPMTLEAWNDAGRPRSWSEILDHFMSGLYENRTNNFTPFCVKYLEILKQSRLKKELKI